jgi:alkylhydroperoxidase family enzyme
VKALGDEKLVQAILDDYKSAPIDGKLRAMLAFLEKQTLTPEALNEADAAALREAGVDADAAESAMYAAYVFNVMDRLADAFDFKVNDAHGLKWVARILLKVGYGAGCVPG